MKRIINNTVGAMLLTLALTACHQDSDVLTSYDRDDNLTFAEASGSFAGKFKVTWNGLNQYYGIWDYEANLGVDWDKTYEEFLPKFEALDKRDPTTNPVKDDELREMMGAFLNQLHDGHLYVSWENHHTREFVGLAPSWARNEKRYDADVADRCTLSLDFYMNLNNGRVMTDDTGNAVAATVSSKPEDIVYEVVKTDKETVFETPDSTKTKIGARWLQAKMAEHEDKMMPTDHEVHTYNYMKSLAAELEKLEKKFDDKKFDSDEDVKTYNDLVVRYSFLEVPGMIAIDKGLSRHGMVASSAMLKGNTGAIAYLYFSNFKLSPYLTNNTDFDMTNTQTAYYISQMKNVWNLWYDNIQTMHKDGNLEGVIIDLRGNGGGSEGDEKYIMGALMEQGDFQYGWSRFKRGTGRYDYSPLVPSITKALEWDQEVIDDKPIVVLTNCRSGSMSEMTATIAQCLPNGRVIGKRSAGGLSGLQGIAASTYNYASYVGVENVTPVYCYIATQVDMDMDKNIREGVGVTPDIEVDLDETLFKTTGEDTQLNRAIEYIKTGK